MFLRLKVLVLVLILLAGGIGSAEEMEGQHISDHVIYLLQVVELDSQKVKELGIDGLESGEKGFMLSYDLEILEFLEGGLPRIIGSVAREEREEQLRIAFPRLETRLGRAAILNLTQEEYSYAGGSLSRSGIFLEVEPVKADGKRILSRVEFSSLPRTAALETKAWIGSGWEPLGIVSTSYDTAGKSLLFSSARQQERHLAFYLSAVKMPDSAPGKQMVKVGSLDGLDALLWEVEEIRDRGSAYLFLGRSSTGFQGGGSLSLRFGDRNFLEIIGASDYPRYMSLGLEREIIPGSLRLGGHIKKVGKERPWLLAMGASDSVEITKNLHFGAGYYPLMFDPKNRVIRSTCWWMEGTYYYEQKTPLFNLRYLSMGETRELSGKMILGVSGPLFWNLNYRSNLSGAFSLGLGIGMDLSW